MKKICKQCNKEFQALRESMKYCSRECFQVAIKVTSQISKTSEERIIRKLSSEQPIVIACLADAHNNMDYMDWFVEEVQKHENWFVMITGDLWDADQYSTHPTLQTKPLSQSVQEVKEALLPIANRIIGFIFGNHEERCFRSASGKGSMPSYFDIFFEAIKTKNPEFQVAKPMQSFIVEVTVLNKTWRVLFKHGKSAGKNFGVLEFRDVLDVNDKVDVIVLSHLHLPEHRIVKLVATKSIEEEENNGEDRVVHLIRTTGGVPFLPYQDKGNMFVSPLGITKLYFNDNFEVELT